MKPLGEWTTEEIIEELKFGHGIPEACDGTEPLLSELLRREREQVLREVVEPKVIGAAIRDLLLIARADERERCAKMFDAKAAENDGERQAYYWKDAADIIRGLQ